MISVFLEGDFPAEFKRLQMETKQYLEDIKSLNPKIRFRFISPEGKEEKLVEKGMDPIGGNERWREKMSGEKKSVRKNVRGKKCPRE